MTRKRIAYIQMCTACFLLIRFAMHVLETIQFFCIAMGMLLLLHELLERTRQTTNILDQTDTGLVARSKIICSVETPARKSL